MLQQREQFTHPRALQKNFHFVSTMLSKKKLKKKNLQTKKIWREKKLWRKKNLQRKKKNFVETQKIAM